MACHKRKIEKEKCERERFTHFLRLGPIVSFSLYLCVGRVQENETLRSPSKTDCQRNDRVITDQFLVAMSLTYKCLGHGVVSAAHWLWASQPLALSLSYIIIY